MKKRVIVYLLFCVLGTCLNCQAIPINWTGTGSGVFGGTNPTVWTNVDNWSPKQIPTAADDVQIGVTAFTNSPVLSGSTTIKSLTFGALSTGSLTVNSGVTLTVTGDISQKHNNNNTSVTISLLGTSVGGVLGGTITCAGSLYIGDITPPPTPSTLALLAGQINITNLTSLNIGIQTLNVGQNVILNTTSNSAFPIALSTVNSSNVNNPIININNGSLLVGQNIQTTNSLYVNTVTTGYTTAANRAQVLNNPATNLATGTSSTLSFGGSISTATGGTIDFYGSGQGKSTVIYSGAATQTVYTASTAAATIGVMPSIYQNLSFSGAGTKAVQAGSVILPGDWNSAGGKVDVISNGTAFVFTGAAQALTDVASDGGKGVIFGNVKFEGTGTKTLSGKFSIANTGVLTMGGTATLAAGGNLTLISDATSSASVAVIPTGTAITGNVNVQRFFKGSSTDLTKRGYRLISSPVYTGMPASTRFYDLKYLLNNAYVSGMAGGGFNAPTGNNPTLYLYREDIAASSAAFTSGNFKGISKINNVNTYDIGTQKRFTITNVADTTTNIPVGNGVLFYFRGNKTDNNTQTGNKVTAPFDYPEDVTFTQVGILNTGTVNVKQWFMPAAALSYTNSSGLNNATVRGFTLVGNPYASTINWEKFNRNGTNSSIYGGGFPSATVTRSKIWIFNPSSKQYNTYIQGDAPAIEADTTTAINPAGSIHTGEASNMIASGQGFFIRTTTTGQMLSFRETAKTISQPEPASLIKLMSIPGSPAIQNTKQNSPKPMLRFKLVKDSINTDDVVLAFNSTTGTKFSDTDDAEDLNGNGALVILSLISSDNVNAAIKQLQLPKTGQQTIPLLADATTSGLYKLILTEAQTLPLDYDVWLKDAFTNDSLDIKNHTTYNFNIYKNNAATFGSKRFTIIVRQNAALAMHELGFNAVKTPAGSQLTWITENELNNYRFNIQRSIDGGKSFQQLSQVQSSGIGNYVYMDTNPIKGINQYKIGIENLKTDLLNYTNTITVTYADTVVDNAASITVYPNPTASMVNIKMPATTSNDGLYTMRILNSSGRVMKQLITSQLSWQQSVTDLLPGTYIVQVINNRDNKIQGKTKFVKL